MGIYEDILEWSLTKPLWQQDALRRIITQERLSDEDVESIICLCLAEHDLSEPTTPEYPMDDEHGGLAIDLEFDIDIDFPDFDADFNLTAAAETEVNTSVDTTVSVPLSANHIPTQSLQNERVQLVGIQNVKEVNALAPNQQLSFQPDGLTIVFGYNGSGKSGYARILRSLCQARHKGIGVLPNAFLPPTGEPAAATIDFLVGGANKKLEWIDKKQTDSNFERIGFFDSECAAIHVDSKNEVAFTPTGLDVLPKLVSVFQSVQEHVSRLETEAGLKASVLTPSLLINGTSVQAELDGLSGSSEIETFETLAQMSDADCQRLSKLKELVGADTAGQARRIQQSVARLNILLQQVNGIEEHLNNTERLRSLSSLVADLSKLKINAKAATDRTFENEEIIGVGESAWQLMWDAAREFSNQLAYPDKPFPFVEEDSRCVLCHQELDSDAKKRLIDFEAFVRNEIQSKVAEAEKALEGHLDAVRSLVCGHDAYSNCLVDLPDSESELYDAIRRYFRLAWKARRHVLANCEELRWTDITDLSDSPLDGLVRVIADCRTHASELESAAKIDKRQELLEEKSELEAKEWLGSVIDDLQVEIDRLKYIEKIKAVKTASVTASITRKNNELSDKYMTETLRKRLNFELKAIRAERIKIELADAGGQYGQKQLLISLDGAEAKTVTRQILSEGEYRSIAIAAFLADLSTESTGSAVVFDDPVSSMDHEWRRLVANRLADLSSKRQVVVFTHEIGFLMDLKEHCVQKDIAVHECYIERSSGVSGVCLDGSPWIALTVKSRMGVIKDRFQKAQSIHRNYGSGSYDPLARQIFGLMRATWERCVEELLLNGAVVRFDRAIHTQKLRRLIDITDEDIDLINLGMTKCSRFIEGHDEAYALNDPVPGPEELKEDIEDFEKWIKSIRIRRK